MTIAITALKEKIRRRDLYIVSGIGVLILLLFGSGSGSLSIGGVPVTDYRVLGPVMLIVVNAVSCILTAVMSVGTIPNEYERGASHLIWIRHVPQWRYHGELAFANVLAGWISETILFAAMFVFMLINHRADQLWRLAPAWLILGINVAAVGLLASLLSVLLPKFAAGAIASAAALAGIFHSLLGVLKDMAGGFGGELIRYALKLVPNLHEIQAQAGKALYGGRVDVHVILTGLLAVYVYTALLFVVKTASD